MIKPQVILIAAVARNRAIGLDNQLLWRLPEDLKRFKALTTGHPILMGRKTFESLGRPLPGRRNVVVSRNPEWQTAGAEVFASLEAALAACAGAEKVFVIGGAEIYRQALPLTDVLDLTEVDDAPHGDVFFPELEAAVWQEVSREAHQDAASGIRYDFVEYRKVV
ncbi:dihydrofolate reductase [Formivibrio citricus]|uniref:Dihydrofolate reductase n=1 Tax=Formivibrio citricus TaxID=83765 RepID=A0A1I4XFX5_9NEIS|nr:dihydrofolate reductase [Formivibrio citricus]SFN24383.1 dihydrofolate reductase [Formivibrio citricus]